MEFTDGGVSSKNRWKSAWLGATAASFRIMYSQMKDVLAFRPVCQHGTPEQGLSPTLSPPYPHAA
jgi:hypothetical protein